MDTSNLLPGGLNLDSEGFKHLLDSQSLVDCTLACDGGKISAHKIVLSACSSYLAKILHDHPVEHPIIILPELNIEDVKTLVHYMYTGELLNTLHSTSLLKTAAILCVNSLNDLLNGTANNLYFGINNSNNIITNNQIVNLMNNSSNNNNNNNNNNISNIVNSNPTTITAYHHGSNDGLPNTTSNNNSNKSSEFQFKCPVCHNDFQTICSFEYHMQRVHNVTSFGCEICHKPFASLRYVLTDHMRRCHGWKAEQKLQC